MTSKCNNESVTPAHYQKDGEDLLSHLEHIMSEDEMRGAYRFNIMKYATRAGRKDDINLEIDKIIQYAKRWKKFEESIESPSATCEEKMWTKEDSGDFKPILKFMQKYYSGEEILSHIYKSTRDDNRYRLMLSGSPAYIDNSEFLVTSDVIAYYSKRQLIEFFDKCESDKFMNLEILAKKA